jgi:hypothetical protein
VLGVVGPSDALSLKPCRHRGSETRENFPENSRRQIRPESLSVPGEVQNKSVTKLVFCNFLLPLQLTLQVIPLDQAWVANDWSELGLRWTLQPFHWQATGSADNLFPDDSIKLNLTLNHRQFSGIGFTSTFSEQIMILH